MGILVWKGRERKKKHHFSSGLLASTPPPRVYGEWAGKRSLAQSEGSGIQIWARRSNIHLDQTNACEEGNWGQSWHDIAWYKPFMCTENMSLYHTLYHTLAHVHLNDIDVHFCCWCRVHSNINTRVMTGDSTAPPSTLHSRFRYRPHKLWHKSIGDQLNEGSCRLVSMYDLLPWFST